MDAAKRSRKAAKGWVTRAIGALQTVIGDKESDQTAYEESLAELNKHKNKLEEAQSLVESLTTSDEELDAEITSVEASYAEVMAIRVIAIRNLRKLQSIDGLDMKSASSENCQFVRLPKLELPRFSGIITDWPSWWDQFKATIDDGNLPAVTKMTYLQNLLQGEAKTAIEGLTLTEKHYGIAKELLHRRYGRPELIVFSHIQSLINLQASDNCKDNLSKLRSIQDQVNIHVRSLDALGVTGKGNGLFLTPMILSRLPLEVRMEWSREGQGKEDNLGYLLDFLKKEIERRERAETFKVDTKKNDVKKEEKQNPRNYGRRSTGSALQTTSRDEQQRCAFCHRNNHASKNCWTAKKLSMDDRRQAIQKARLCYRCLCTGHMASICQLTCATCKGKHHRVLCDKYYAGENQTSETGSENEAKKPNYEGATVSCVSMEAQKKSVLLQTVRATVKGPRGQKEINVLFDSGSDKTYVTKELVKNLQLETVEQVNHKYTVFGGAKSSASMRKIVKVVFAASQQNIEVKAMEIPVICAPLVRPKIPEEIIQKVGVPLAMGPTSSNVKIDMLIGLDNYWRLMSNKLIKIEDENLVAQESVFGYILSGQFTGSGQKSVSPQLLVLNDISEECLRNFWELDHIGIREVELDSNEDAVLSEFKNTIKFSQGRYEVGLPWKKEGTFQIVDNEESAKKRLNSLVRRFHRDPELNKEYDKVLSNMENEAIIENVPPEEKAEQVFYLPHHPVIKESSTSTKVRPVFDGSAKGPNGVSLNECLESGPSLIPDLVAVLIRFRRWPVALSADITKAFLQVALKKEDRDVHRFLWWCAGEIRKMRFTRVTFGINCSPFLLNATIKHHLEQFSESDVVKELKQNLYVDDWLTGANTKEEAQTLFEQGTEIMEKAGMTLAKWQSNKSQIVMKDTVEGEIPSESSVKVLGIKWSKNEDILTFEGIEIPSELVLTKRLLLSLIARVFDPLGFLNPFLMYGKILFQKLWQFGIEWDDEIPEEISIKLKPWIESLESLKCWRIQRSYSSDKWLETDDQVELHVFSDAAETGYGAVVYIKIFKGENNPDITLVISKARVAPLKRVTLPRLELLGCLLAARLLTFVKKSLALEYAQYHCWSDSQVALAWIKGNPHKWKQFVANRVTEIQSVTDPSHWHHCPGKQNPADLLTRGVLAEQMLSSEEWLSPRWIKEKQNVEVTHLTQTVYAAIEAELLASESYVANSSEMSYLCSHHTEQEQPPLFKVNRWNDLLKSIHVVGWVRRFVNNCQKHEQKLCGELSHRERQSARETLIKQSQGNAFGSELENLKRGSQVPKSSKLFELTSMLDNGIIRVKGRLQNANLTYEEKHPIILPRDDLAKLIVEHYHKLLKHAGVSTLLTEIRNSYWIIGLRRLAKSVVKGCLPCQRMLAKSCNQEGAPLPQLRTNKQAPFSVVGVDYAGPLYTSDHQDQKLYICLFTCFTVRAVHLELTMSLTTDDFLLAFRRFAARRKLPKMVFSDNGKTFVGAQPKLQSMYGDNTPEWKFIVPRSPWRGGIWERLVRSVKSVLKICLGKRRVTRSELEALLFEAEFVVNSRPLTQVTDEIGDTRPITPNDFLLGQDTPGKDNIPELYAKRQGILSQFWKVWSTDYLRNLPQMVPQFQPKGALKVGSMVLVREDNIRRLMWPLAKVIELVPGQDGKVRTVRLLYSNGKELMRPIQRLHHLELLQPDVPGSSEIEPVVEVPRSELEPVVEVPRSVMETVPVKEISTRHGRRVKPINRLDL